MNTNRVEPADSSAHVEREASKSASVTALMRWYAPYLKGHGLLTTGLVLSLIVMLGAAGTLPLVIEHLLKLREEKGVTSTSFILLMVTLVVLQIAASHKAHLWAHRLSIASAHTLRLKVFAKSLTTEALTQGALVRSSVVLRHSSDVEAISEAFETSAAEGAPAVVRIIQSLILLTWIEWRAGVMMIIATLIFLLYRKLVGKRMRSADQLVNDTNEDLASAVDETISGARVIRGLRLQNWHRARFNQFSEEVEEASYLQGTTATRLFTGAELTGLSGLMIVVLFALLIGGAALAGVAAAILYVNEVVSGLEDLPPWLRAVQLASVSQREIDEILLLEDSIKVPDATQGESGEARRSAPSPGLSIRRLTKKFDSGLLINDVSISLPTDRVIGVVMPIGSEPDDFLTLLSGEDNPETGRVELDGQDVRMPGISNHLAHVPSEAIAFDDSALNQLRAVEPGLTEDGALELLEVVGLAHIADLPGGLTAPLGHSGSRLTLSERQRFTLAIAVAQKPRVLLLGSLLAFAEPDTALPLLSRLRGCGIETIILGVKSPELANAVDDMIFSSGGHLFFGTHHELLVSQPSYSALWEQRLTGGEVDLSALGIPDDAFGALLTRLVTEHYEAGDTIYREGDEADRVLFAISGRIEISTTDSEGKQRRVAVLGPGNHCGDLRLAQGEKRAETATALESCIVRALSREALAAGMSGALDREPDERRIVTAILRNGPATRDEICALIPDLAPEAIDTALEALIRDAGLVEADGAYSMVMTRSAKRGSASVLDRLGGL